MSRLLFVMSFVTTLTLMSVQSPLVNADMAFEDRTKESGLTKLLHGGHGSSWGDFNGDGWPDVWISNHLYRPNLYINNGDGTFIDQLDHLWQGNPNLDAHGSAWADFDNDGDQDLVELAGANQGTAASNKPFYVNHENMLFDEANERGLNDFYSRGRTPLWLDWNNDGLLDLYMANFPRTQDTLGPTRLMLQQIDGSFAPASGMTLQEKHFFSQIAYFDSAVHLVMGGSHYPNRLYQLGDAIPLPVVLEPSNLNLFNIVDVAIADFDGDLSDDLFVLRVGSGVSAKRINKTTRRRFDVEVFDLTAGGTGKGLVLAFDGPSQPVIRVYGGGWTSEMVFFGSSGNNLETTKFVKEVVNGRTWKHLELMLDADNPTNKGILPKKLRETPGIYVGQNLSGRWLINVRGNAGKQFRAQIISADTDSELLNVKAYDGTGVLWSKQYKYEPVILSRRDGAFHATGLGNEVACNSVAAGDFDNDMDTDLYLACTKSLGNAHNILLENVDGSFFPVPGAGGAQTKNMGVGGRVSVADYDNDGYLDLLVTDGGGSYPFHFGRRYLLHNKGGSNHWLKIVLEGCQSNRDGIGARVVVQAGGRQQARLQANGIRNGVQDDQRLHFGLAQNVVAESVVVDWPSGTHTSLTNLAADQIHVVRENEQCER